mgnify:FL=1|nr:MAG TPA: hypothetical protein [Caudoviricetes sp.]
MAVELTASAAQTVQAGQNVLFTDTPVGCNRGYVVHREGAGLVTLRGMCNGCANFARYKVLFVGNIAVPTGGTPGAISVALSIGGEAIQQSTATVTPTVADSSFNVTTAAFVDVPKGCCVSLAVKNINAQAISVANANLLIERVA